MNLIRRATLIGLLLVGFSGPTAADVVTDWNEKAVAAGYAATAGVANSRNVAIVHVAMFEALNSIEPRYAPYRAALPVMPGASREAAAATAAHYVLVRAYPSQAKELDKALQASLAAVGEGSAKTNGVRLGEAAAAAILAERSTDGANAPIPTVPSPPRARTSPLFSQWDRAGAQCGRSRSRVAISSVPPRPTRSRAHSGRRTTSK